MAKKTSNGTANKTPRFTIEAPKASASAVAKLVIPRIPVGDLVKTIEGLLKQIETDGISAVRVRGSLTLY